jgi:hypothetical protein
MSKALQQQLNQWGFEKHPFVFLIDFECLKPMCWSLKEPIINFEYNFNGVTNIIKRKNLIKEFDKNVQFLKNPISLDCYQRKFNQSTKSKPWASTLKNPSVKCARRA